MVEILCSDKNARKVVASPSARAFSASLEETPEMRQGSKSKGRYRYRRTFSSDVVTFAQPSTLFSARESKSRLISCSVQYTFGTSSRSDKPYVSRASSLLL